MAKKTNKANKANRPAKAEKAEHLKAFGGSLAVTGIWAKRVDLFGIQIPVAGIAIVVGLALIGVTIWGIIFSRAPAHITQHIDHRSGAAGIFDAEHLG